jgi:hypothetical protein
MVIFHLPILQHHLQHHKLLYNLHLFIVIQLPLLQLEHHHHLQHIPLYKLQLLLLLLFLFKLHILQNLIVQGKSHF